MRAIPTPEIVDFGPKAIQAGEPVTVCDGHCAMWLSTVNATPETIVVMRNRALESSYAGPKKMSALIPDEFIDHPGFYEFYLLDRGTHKKSETRVLIVEGAPALASV
ncbi:MAG TPA: hypothetical protein PK847_08240 [Candidatus Sumerlaeota bacterium]|nr:MAG: hypothetical protein BWZ08_02363 [candidate division BRC1 bacterium ADurb.BinA292]HOE96561.1 hypothetical protein [Candidatus Sumerlaeota bacterium]HOR27807.1 hypothetical protein [Candidatus Sumerlaeota bacterium]